MRLRERYGSSVSGPPFWLRVTLTCVMAFPALVLARLTVLLLLIPSLWALLTATILVLAAYPPIVIAPHVWRRTDESVYAEWRGRDEERAIRREVAQLAPRRHASLSGEQQPPPRW